MLSSQLQRYFSALGIRLQIRTDPKGTHLRLSPRTDSRGDYLQLRLPWLSRSLVAVLAIQPRRKRLLLRLGRGKSQAYVIIEMHPDLLVRSIKRKQARQIVAGAWHQERHAA
jgi:hypothetical protein